MPAKPKIEYRIVCANHGTSGHSSHALVKNDLKKAKQSVIDLNHRAEMKSNLFYGKEAPYVIETREVGPWGVLT